MSSFLEILIQTIIIYFPAMASNGAPVLVVKGTPIDKGRFFIDNKRIFGDGKTIEGSILFLLVGLAIGSIYASYTLNSYFYYYGFLSGLGAFLGDLVGAFIKRRLGISRGDPAPLLDQTLFLVFATLIIKLSRADELVHLFINIETYVTGIMLTSILHIATNYGAYKLRLKQVPY